MAAEGLRERKKRETRIALSWAAVRLVAERGYDSVRVEDIAAEAGVSLRTFGNYFSSKAAAIAARHTDRVIAVAEALRGRPAAEPLWAALRAAMADSFALGETGHGATAPPEDAWAAGVRLMMSEPALRGELLKANEIAIQEMASAVAERTGTTGLYPRLVAAVVSATITASVEQWLATAPARSMHDVLTEALDLVQAGLPAPARHQ